MKIKIVLLLSVFFALSSIEAQEKETSFRINEGDEIYKFYSIKDQGFVIITAKSKSPYVSSKVFPWEVKYYDLDLNLIDQTSLVEKNTIHPSRVLRDVSTNSFIFVKDYGVAKSLVKIVSKDKPIKGHHISKDVWKKASPGNLKDMFLTQNSLNYLSSVNGKENHPKQKVDEKLVLYAINLSDFSEKITELNLPKITTDPKKSTFWDYTFKTKNGFYLVSSFSPDEKGIQKRHRNFLHMNMEGEVTKTINLTVERKGVARINSCYTQFDTTSKHIYAYGLEQLTLNLNNNDKSNLFIMQYDYDGNLIWERTVEGLSVGNGYLPLDIGIKGDDLSLELNASNIQVVWKFKSNGDFIENYSTNREELTRIKGSYIPIEGTDSYEYFKKCRSREHMYYSLNLTKAKDRGVLIEHNDETGFVKVGLFKK